MLIKNILLFLVSVFCSILRLVFGLFPDVDIPTTWVSTMCNILDWAEYFLPVRILYQQAGITIGLVAVYLIIRLVLLVLRLIK